MYTRILVLVTALLAPLAVTGCTAQYSQSLVGSMPASGGQKVSSKATGLAILQITVQEPTSAYDQVSNMLQNCKELSRVEVDYRDLYFFLFSIPSVKVTGDCTQ